MNARCPICSMVLVYLPTKLGDFVRANVGKYSSTMQHLGMFCLFICWFLKFRISLSGHLPVQRIPSSCESFQTPPTRHGDG